MSLIQDRVILYSMKSYRHEDADGIVHETIRKFTEAEWHKPSGTEVVLAPWMRRGIEEEGWAVEVIDGAHMIADYEAVENYGEDQHDDEEADDHQGREADLEGGDAVPAEDGDREGLGGGDVDDPHRES